VFKTLLRQSGELKKIVVNLCKNWVGDSAVFKGLYFV